MDIVNLITNVGFPIACCITLGIYVDKQNKQNREDVKELNREHNEEIKLALDNNTQAIKELTEFIRKGNK